MVQELKTQAPTEEQSQVLAGVKHVARYFVIDRRAKVGTALLVTMGAIAIIGALGIVPHDPAAVYTPDRLQGPSWSHWMGTDRVGRDVLSRVMVALHLSLLVAVVAVLIAMAIGTPAGAISGFQGGRTDAVIMRFMDAVIAFPSRLLAIVLVVLLGPSLMGLWFAIAFGSIPTYARLIRGGVLVQKEREYVEAAYGLGESRLYILLRYIVPNGMTPVMVRVPLNMAQAVIAEATLSFLGLGFVPPTISLGQMISGSGNYLEVAPWLMIFPALMLSTLILGFVLLGDSLRDHLDPRSRRIRVVP